MKFPFGEVRPIFRSFSSLFSCRECSLWVSPPVSLTFSGEFVVGDTHPSVDNPPKMSQCLLVHFCPSVSLRNDWPRLKQNADFTRRFFLRWAHQIPHKKLAKLIFARRFYVPTPKISKFLAIFFGVDSTLPWKPLSSCEKKAASLWMMLNLYFKQNGETPYHQPTSITSSNTFGHY